MIRHFGLKILEDVVKARWNSMVPEEKVFIKDSLMKLMASGTGHITVEHLYIKVKILVLMGSPLNHFLSAGRGCQSCGGAD